jgi:hypothetical protein
MTPHLDGGGQAVDRPKGEWVRYSTPTRRRRFAVCLPGLPDLVHRDVTAGSFRRKRDFRNCLSHDPRRAPRLLGGLPPLSRSKCTGRWAVRFRQPPHR